MQARVPGKRRFRFLQFSLRTLLVVTFLVAVACAYYLQPPSREELLAGGKLRLWRQVKLVHPEKLVNHGRWTLSDENGATISTGYYQDGAQAGRWITYHPSGKKAIEGKMSHGVRVGVWKSWYASGQLQTETTFAAEPRKRTFPSDPTGEYQHYTQYRDGPARGWHASGRPQFEGSYSSDKQEGVWTYYDANGRTLSRGPYRAGKRHGEWTLRDDEQPARVVRYIDGRTQEQLQLRVAQLKKHIRDPYGALTPAHPVIVELESLGEAAVPVLTELLCSDGPWGARHVFVVQVLHRLGPQASAALPQLRQLAATTNEVERLEVMSAIYAIDPAARGELFKPLLATGTLNVLTTMFDADSQRRTELFDQIISYGLDSPPDASYEIVRSISELDGDLAPHLARHSMSSDPRVRERVAQVLIVLRGYMVARWEKIKTSWEDCQPLIERLQNDTDPSVQAAAKVQPRSGGMGAGFF